MKLDGIEIISRIFCEDVREEKSNKFIIIGAYSGDMLLSAIPGTVSVCVYLEIKADTVGEQKFTIRYSGPGENSAQIEVALAVDDEKQVHTVHIPKIGLIFSEEGSFKVDISQDEELWINLITKKVTLAPTVSEQPC